MKIIDLRIREKLGTKARRMPNYHEFMANIEPWQKIQSFDTMQNMLLSAFKWDSTPQGHDYWQKVFDSIELEQIPLCPKCQRRYIVSFKKTIKMFHCKQCDFFFK